MESRDSEKFLCRKCGAELPPQFFTRDRSRSSGRAKYCRKCESDKFKAWYAENRDRVIQRVQRNKQRLKGIVAAGEVHEPSAFNIRAVYNIFRERDSDEQ